jgi:hypothetical protein
MTCLCATAPKGQAIVFRDAIAIPPATGLRNNRLVSSKLDSDRALFLRPFGRPVSAARSGIRF